ncbi:MAG: 7-cyano-7-deazaguanine synthase [Gammaproteobacteria bacterium]|jgi:7-cyano-7-deazaguanine synthase
MSAKPRAIILLSGGLDSATVLAMVKDQGLDAYALSFQYGQRHTVELEAAKNLAKHYEVIDHQIVNIDLRQFGGSALTDDDIAVPKGRDEAEMGDGIPITYVPARNTIFLSYALAWAEVLKAQSIYIGVNAVDYSGYPDCRPEFVQAFETMANLSTEIGTQGAGIKILAPLQFMSKAEIVQAGLALGVDYSKTNSCYDPADSGAPCGECDACQLRTTGFTQAGLVDPLITAFLEEPLLKL